MRTIVLILSATTLATAAPYQLRADKTGWGECSHADLEKVLRSSCDAIAQHLGDRELPEAIRVRHDASGPIALFRRNVRGEIVVQLSSKDRLWSQHAYQMAHEFAHVLGGFREGDKANLWFEETLCELASLFSIRSMAQSWKTDPPYPNWKPYAKSLRSYAADLETKHRLPDGVALTEFVAEHLDHLRENPTDRPKNAVIALALLPLFETEPASAWRAVRFLNAGRAKEALSFAEYLANWRNSCPPPLRPKVGQIAKALGVKL